MRLLAVLLAVVTLLTAGSQTGAGASTAAVKKKGVSAWKFNGVTAAMSDSGVGWFYTWASGKEQIQPRPGSSSCP
ncbi:hypothetical protein SVIO_014820 [Streptomyces violaceusniger]|uniref:Uncharacterized protein n=1 Tax=Streptomyces violaceusniger TaxID=68280 RepID=A0A4D4KYG6_STRVO|nr:hypothetical protein SVIO_014820 [Streptomyces violaceusniger]